MFGNHEKQLLRQALVLYAGEQVLKGIQSYGEAFLRPQARTVELSMLYFDVASFTNPVDGIGPVELGQWTTSFAEAVTNTVAGTGGTFDVFVGDSGSAWWGENGESLHADQALECAHQLLGAIEQLNSQAHASDYPVIRLKIGIHTGLVSLGNFGSSNRLRYTIMGDAVNFASRLCSVAPHYSQSVVLSEATYRRLGDASRAKYLDAVKVKGKDDPVRIYSATF